MHNYLKKYYFINKFDKNHLEKIDHNVHIIYRNYNKPIDIKSLKKLKAFCKKEHFKLALKFGLEGVYLPSFNRSFAHNSYQFKKKFEIIGSAHNLSELNIKIKQGVNEIFFSPVFKKKNKFLGIYGFLSLKKYTKKKSIVLGGVENSKINLINFLKADGYAGISLYKKKGPLKKGP